MTNIKIYSAETNTDAGIFVTLGTRWIYFSGADAADFIDFDGTDFNDFYQRTDIGTMTVGENADQVIAEFEHCELIDT